MTYSQPAHSASVGDRRPHLWPAVAVVLTAALAACGGGSTSPAVPSIASRPPSTVESQPATNATRASGSAPSGDTPLSQAEAYSRCMRSHGALKFPDPVLTPGGGYGYRTIGIDPHSGGFQAALQACKTLPSPWNSTGQQLSAAEQQAWLRWAKCIRSEGIPDFPDPTFSGGAVHITGESNSSQLRSAMDACRSQMPATGGLGG